jgi:hypothetical protein
VYVTVRICAKAGNGNAASAPAAVEVFNRARREMCILLLVIGRCPLN